jgi:hypothetical protein
MQSVYLGAYGGIGWATDSDNDLQDGWFAGAETMYTAGAATFYGQLGWADIRVDDEDSGFTGYTWRLGAIYAFNEAWAVNADLAMGYAPENFADEDEDDDGLYGVLTLAAARSLGFGNLTFGYELGGFSGIDEGDSAVSHTVKIGFAIPLGGSGSASDAFSPLDSTLAPFQAASWADRLD